MANQPLIVDPSQVQSITVDPSAVQSVRDYKEAQVPETNWEWFKQGLTTDPWGQFKTGVSHLAQGLSIEPQDGVEKGIFTAGGPLALVAYRAGKSQYDTAKKAVQKYQEAYTNHDEGALQEAHGYATAAMLPLVGPFAAHLGEAAGANEPVHAATEAVGGALLGKAMDPSVVEAVPGAIDTTGTAIRGAVKGGIEANKGMKSVPVHVATGTAGALTPLVGPHVAGGLVTAIEGLNTTIGAVRGARQALAERAAAQTAADAQAAQAARVAQSRAIPPTYQAVATPVPPSPEATSIPPDAEALQAQRTARQELNARIVAARQQQAATSPTGPAGPSPELLEGIAQAYLKKPFARLNAAEQVTVRLLASKVAGASASEAAPAAPQVSGPSPVVSPQGTPVPPALPAAPPVPEATQAPAATPVATPSSPEAQALVPTAQSAVSPAATAPPAPAESPSQLTGRMLVIPSAKGTAHVPEGAIEYYPSGGPAHIPTPGELGFGRYVPEGTPMDSSTLAHIQAENHKAFNAASYAFRQGIVDPSVLDDMTEAQKRDFMNEALAHGREVGNPTPKTKYQASREPGGSILGGHTLTLAKAHLQKMLDDGAAAPEELPPGDEPPSAPPGPAALEAGQAVVKGNLRKSLTDILKDETGSVGKGSGIDPQTRKQLVDEAARLTSQVAEKVRRGVTTATEAAGRVAQGVRQAVSPKTVSPAATEAVRNGVEKSLNDYTRLLPGEGEFHAAEAGRRGERELAERTRLTGDEKQIIQDAVSKVKPEEQRGLARSIEQQVREKKAAFPTSGELPFQPLELKNVTLERDRSGNLNPKVAFQATPYSFDDPVRGQKLWKGSDLTPAGEKASDAMAAKIVEEVNQIRQTARDAESVPPDQRTLDQHTAVKINAQRNWYNSMRTLLRKTFGSAGDLLSDLLGATSARTPVGTNLDRALEALDHATGGKYTDVLRDYKQYREAGGTPKNYTGPLALREGGKKFNANTMQVMDALIDQFRGKPGTPKTQNYAGNLIGATNQATIDVWAARMLQRIRHNMYGDAPAVAQPAEVGVSGQVSPRGNTGQFMFGQKVFEKAAQQLNMQPHELQALMWFAEKDLWTRKGWTSKVGEGGDMAALLRAKGLQRAVAGIAPQDATIASNAVDMMKPAHALAQADPNIASVVNTHALGMWDDPGGHAGGVPEHASNYEFTVKPGPTSEQSINRQTAEIIKAAKANKQDDVFVARSIPDEQAGEEHARPALSVYFKKPLSGADAWKVFEKVRTQNIGGVTLFGSPQAAPGTYAGMRFIYMPEYVHAAEQVAGLGPTELTDMLDTGKEAAQRDIFDISTRLKGDDRVGHAMLEYYDALNVHKTDYDNAIRSLTVAPGPEAANRAGPQAAAANDVSGSGPWRRPISTSVAERARSKLSAGSDTRSGAGAAEAGQPAVEPTPQETAAQTVARLRKKKRR